MILLLLKLLIAHILGDFVLQPNLWVAQKRKNTFRSKYLYFHGLVHLLTLLVLLEFDISLWPSITIIVVSHLIIDYVKLILYKRFNERILFTIDQILHLGVIAGVVYINEPYKILFKELYSSQSLLFILSILTVTYVSSILIKIIMSKWILREDKASDSLKNAGMYIGILERLFVFGFVLLNQWSAIGLLITAKSVLRFNDLSNAKDRKLTEYILIGTLMSIGLAIAIGLLYKNLVVLT